MPNSNIPIIDISALLNSDLSQYHISNSTHEVNHVLEQINSACRNIGFFYIKNYGFPEQTISDALGVMKKFFALPDEKKRQYLMSESINNVGYTPIGEENLDIYTNKDHKEAFDISPDLAPEQNLDNIDISGIKQLVNDYYVKLYQISMVLLQAFALSLGEKHDKFTAHFKNQSGIILKFLHYPPNTINNNLNDSNIVCGAHSDYGYLTILRQDQIGGLQVFNKQGKWQDARPIDKTFIVNIGDLMQRWTNNVYTSTKHRVINTNSKQSRYSIPFFVEPNYHTVISSLKSCINEKNPAQYEDIISGDWINKRLNETHEYRQLAQ